MSKSAVSTEESTTSKRKRCKHNFLTPSKDQDWSVCANCNKVMDLSIQSRRIYESLEKMQSGRSYRKSLETPQSGNQFQFENVTLHVEVSVMARLRKEAELQGLRLPVLMRMFLEDRLEICEYQRSPSPKRIRK